MFVNLEVTDHNYFKNVLGLETVFSTVQVAESSRINFQMLPELEVST
jgi:hypothetical protein